MKNLKKEPVELIEPNLSPSSQSSLSEKLQFPAIGTDLDIGSASSDTEKGYFVEFFRQAVGSYLAQHAADFSHKILVPLVRNLRTAVKESLEEKMQVYAEGNELDQGLAREQLEEALHITRSANIGAGRAPRAKTIQRLFKILDRTNRGHLRRMKLTYAEISFGLNKTPLDGDPSACLSNHIKSNNLKGTELETILKAQLAGSTINTRLGICL